MIPVSTPSAQSSAHTQGRVAANTCMDRLADLTAPKVKMVKLRKLHQQRFIGLQEHRADLDSLVAEWNVGFDSILKEQADYVAAGGAAGAARWSTYRRTARKAGALVALLGAVDELPDAEQQQVLAACAKLAREVNDGLDSLVAGDA